MASISVSRKELERTKQALCLTWSEISRILDTTERTIHRWRAGESNPFPSFQRRLDCMNDLLDLMNEIFKKPEHCREWLHKKIPALHNRSPIEMLKAGRIQEVREVLGRAADGILS